MLASVSCRGNVVTVILPRVAAEVEPDRLDHMTVEPEVSIAGFAPSVVARQIDVEEADDNGTLLVACSKAEWLELVANLLDTAV